MRPDDKPFLTIPAAARLLGEPRTTVFERAKRYGHINGVPCIQKTPTQMVVSRAALERAIAGETEPTPEPADMPTDWYERT